MAYGNSVVEELTCVSKAELRFPRALRLEKTPPWRGAGDVSITPNSASWRDGKQWEWCPRELRMNSQLGKGGKHKPHKPLGSKRQLGSSWRAKNLRNTSVPFPCTARGSRDGGKGSKSLECGAGGLGSPSQLLPSHRTKMQRQGIAVSRLRVWHHKRSEMLPEVGSCREFCS